MRAAIEPGRQLLHYRIVEKIGEGGMGAVWKAVDTALDREVAIKVLPVEFAEDAERLARFEREAKLLASLNHPNIATIHGLHEADGVRFLAMELVPGQDLEERLTAGPMASAEALGLARQMAEALEAAHENGIVHRDLKPANVRLTPQGQVKVLDFGLAKAAGKEPGPAGVSLSPTVTSAGTQAGVILGTAAYMSPEQAKGRDVDRRADIWAFGVVLHEMLAGARLFPGNSISEVLAGVLMKDPDWSALPAEIPNSIRNLLRRCLRREPRSRLQHIGDARVTIEEAIGGADIDEEGRDTSRTARRSPLVHLVWAAALLLAVAVVAVTVRDEAPRPNVARFVVAGTTPIGPDNPVISPDGTHIAYTEDGALWVRSLDRLAPRKLADAVVEVRPFWSPDSSRIGFSAHDAIWTVGVGGGEPTTVCGVSDLFQAGDWGTDGKIRFALENGPIYEVSALGGDPRVAVELDGDEQDFQDVHVLPDDLGFLLATRLPGPNLNSAIVVHTGDERSTLIRQQDRWFAYPVYSDTGHLVYQRFPDNSGIWAVPFSLSSLEITGEPFLVVPNGRQPSVSSDGTLVHGSAISSRLQLTWMGRDGLPSETIGPPGSDLRNPVVGPDGKVAVSVGDDGRRRLWLYDPSGGAPSQLTFTDDDVFRMRWLSADEIVFDAHGRDGWAIYRMSLESNERPLKLVDGVLCDVSSDGRYLLYSTGTDDDASSDLRYLVLGETQLQDHPLVESPYGEFSARFSPDGRWVVHISVETGRTEAYLRPFPGGDRRWRVAPGGIAAFDADGDRIYVMDDSGLSEVSFAQRPTVSLGDPIRVLRAAPGNWRGFDVAVDGQRFLVLRRSTGSDGREMTQKIVVVQNWHEEFREATR